MIDIHTHILPGFDDGAVTLEDAVAMARLAAADGIRRLAATPHTLCYGWLPAPGAIRSACDALQAEVDRCGIDLRLACAAEIRLVEDLPRRLRAGEVPALDPGGRYVLLELPRTGDMRAPLAQTVFQLRLQDITPVIAHPELVATFRRHPDTARQAVEQGALLQVTADALVHALEGDDGAEDFVCEWLDEGLVHVVASDAHDILLRPPILSGAREALSRQLGAEAAERLTATNPGRILDGADVLDPPSRRTSRAGRKPARAGGFLGRLAGGARR